MNERFLFCQKNQIVYDSKEICIKSIVFCLLYFQGFLFEEEISGGIVV